MQKKLKVLADTICVYGAYRANFFKPRKTNKLPLKRQHIYARRLLFKTAVRCHETNWQTLSQKTDYFLFEVLMNYLSSPKQVNFQEKSVLNLHKGRG